MKKLYIKQKLFSIGEKFTITDERGEACYYVEGSFFQIPKSFRILNPSLQEIGLVTKKTFSFLPKFFVEVRGREILTIAKDFTFFKAHYSVEAEGIEVDGDWWDMDFAIYRHGNQIARIQKKWLTLGDSYEVEILDESLEEVIISVVIAIDCVKSDDAASSSASS